MVAASSSNATCGGPNSSHRYKDRQTTQKAKYTQAWGPPPRPHMISPIVQIQEKAGADRIGPRGVWTQAGGAGGVDGPWWANAGRIPANPINTNVLVLEEGAKAGKVGMMMSLIPFALCACEVGGDRVQWLILAFETRAGALDVVSVCTHCCIGCRILSSFRARALSLFYPTCVD
jgi:hypothetical protein